MEAGERRTVTVTFAGAGGVVAYQRALTLTSPLSGVEQGKKGSVHFEIQSARGPRYYLGQWDGQKISGIITAHGASDRTSSRPKRARASRRCSGVTVA